MVLFSDLHDLYGLELDEASRPESQWRFSKRFFPQLDAYVHSFFAVHHWPIFVEAISMDEQDRRGFVYCVETDYRSRSSELCVMSVRPHADRIFVMGIGRYIAELFSGQYLRQLSVRPNGDSASLVELLRAAGLVRNSYGGAVIVDAEPYLRWWKGAFAASCALGQTDDIRQIVLKAQESEKPT